MSTEDDLRTFCYCDDQSIGAHWKIVHVLMESPSETVPVTLTMDVKKNSYLLPLFEEEYEISPIRQARMNLAWRMAKTPNYEASKDEIVDYFCEMQTFALRDHMRLMGIKGVSGRRRDLIAKCIGYWVNYLDELTHPIVRSTLDE